LRREKEEENKRREGEGRNKKKRKARRRERRRAKIIRLTIFEGFDFCRCSASPPGVNQVDGLPPVPNNDSQSRYGQI